MAKDKKKFSFGKFILILLLVIVVAICGVAFYAYNLVNNGNKFADKYNDNYETQMAEYANDRFEDYIYYDRYNYVFEYEVPAVLLYQYLNIDSLTKLLGLPEDFAITRIGLDPDIVNRKIHVYLNINYKDKINTCLQLETYFKVSDSNNKIELRYEDFYIINDDITDYVKEKMEIGLKEGDLIATQEIPRYIPYYQMPDFLPEFVYGLGYDGTYVLAKYDIVKAIEVFKETGGETRPMEEKLDGVWLSVRENGLKYDK